MPNTTTIGEPITKTSLDGTEWFRGATVGNNFRIQAANVARIRLTANQSFYVRSDGNDSNSGLANTSGSAWLTLQHAMAYISSTIDIAGFSVTVNIGTGSFVGVSVLSCVGGGSISWVGNGSANTTITIINSDACVEVLQSSGGTSHSWFSVTFDSTSGLVAIVQSPAVLLLRTGLIINASSQRQIFAQGYGSSIQMTSDFTLNNPGTNIAALGYAQQQAVIRFDGNTITVTGNQINWTTSGFYADTLSFLQQQMQFAGVTTATGKKYQIKSNAVMNTFGLIDTANYFIGDTDGDVFNGVII